MEPTLEYQMGYIAGMTTVAVPILWVTGKITSQVASLLKEKTPQTFRQAGGVYYSRKGLDGAKKLGDLLALPGDSILFLGYIGTKMVFDSIFSGKESEHNEAPSILETHWPDTILPVASHDMMIVFSTYIRELPREIRTVVHTSWAQEHHMFFQEFLKMEFEERYDFAEELVSNKMTITSMRDIFLLLAAWKAWMRNIELVHNASVTDGRDDDDSWASLEWITLTQEQIQEMKEKGILSPEEANFLSYATKNPGK